MVVKDYRVPEWKFIQVDATSWRVNMEVESKVT